jgi:hypothetical protein
MIHGRIYKIYCNETAECYYGSTEETLSRRLSVHKSNYKSWKEGQRKGGMTSFRIIERGNFTISLMEEGDFENKYYMRARERNYIENNECVNKRVEGRTKKEWYEANPDYYKQYRKNNREYLTEKRKINHQTSIKFAEQRNQKYTCECGGKYLYGNKTRHFKSKKHLAHLSK